MNHRSDTLVKLALMFFAAVLLATACKRQNVSGDAEIRKLMPGVWKLESPGHTGVPSMISSPFTSELTVAPDLSYHCILTIHARTNGPRTFHIEGTFAIRDGALNDTTMKSSGTNLPVPIVSTGRVVRIDQQEWVMAYGPMHGGSGATNLPVFRRQIE